MIKKKVLNIFIMIISLFLLVGCGGCTHEVVITPTCTEHGYCVNCNKKSGDALGHAMEVNGSEAKCSRCNMEYIKVYFTNIDGLLNDNQFYIESKTFRIYKFYEPNSNIILPTPIKGNKTFIKVRVIKTTTKTFIIFSFIKYSYNIYCLYYTILLLLSKRFFF